MEAFKTIFEKGAAGRVGVLAHESSDGGWVPGPLRRKVPPRLPELSEAEVVRHYTQLSARNFHVDKGFYPLGSCTMKYNPKINEEMAGLAGFAQLHPEQREEDVQGAMQLCFELESMLSEVSGFPGVCLQPAAGAHGEFAGMLAIRAYHVKNGNPRKKVLIPDSAHGTNPASAVMAGYDIVVIQSGEDGRIDLKELDPALDADVAAIMITNPSTLGLYEKEMEEIANRVHACGGLVYMDGANLNALLGLVRPADLGVDVMHFNLHKTFSTPHGGGGPGSGPIGVSETLAPFLPVPRIQKNKEGKFSWNWDLPDSIGRIHGYYGNFLVFVKAYAYLLALGKEGVTRVGRDAIVNANYLASLVADKWPTAYPGPVAHEFVTSARDYREHGVRAIDVAKRLIEHGIHPPTVYFPLIVPEALMVEPTETESKETLDRFAEIMNRIAEEASRDPELLLQAPRNTPVTRLNEVKAAKELKVHALPPNDS